MEFSWKTQGWRCPRNKKRSVR